jgi:hypothetical protein
VNSHPMPRDGGSYRREPDGSLTCLQPTTADRGAAEIAIEIVEGEVEVLDLEAQVHDGSATALPPIESAPRRRTSGRNKE